MANSWLDQCKTGNYLSTVLQVKEGKDYTVRLLKTMPVKRIWKHSCKDSAGKYLKALCIGDRNGCKMCAVNALPEWASKKPRERKFALSSDYVTVVYWYEEKRPMILVGNEVFKQWDIMSSRVDKDTGKNFDIFAHDFSIVRDDSGGQTKYQVVTLKECPFTTEVAEADIPSIDAYVEWLKSNIDRVAFDGPHKMEESGKKEDAAEPKPSFLNREPEQKTETKGGPNKALLDAAFMAITKPFDAGCVAACQQKILKERVAALGEAADKSVDLDHMSDAELVKFMALYKEETKNIK